MGFTVATIGPAFCESCDGATDAFLADVKTLRQRVRDYVGSEGVVDSHRALVERTTFVLNQALALEMVCVLRYKRYFYLAEELGAQSSADEFLHYAAEASDHADMIAARIQQLGGTPECDPEILSHKNHPAHGTSNDVDVMVREDLVAEVVVIAAYREIISWLGEVDATTRQVLEEILAMEQDHVEDMVDLLAVAK